MSGGEYEMYVFVNLYLSKKNKNRTRTEKECVKVTCSDKETGGKERE